MVTPEAWAALGSLGVAAIGFAGVVVQQAQQTRRALQRVGTRVDEVAHTAEAARTEAGTAARQTVATGNGHAVRVEGALAEVLDRVSRIEDLTAQTRSEAAETRADIRGMRADVAGVQAAITRHLQDHVVASRRTM